MASYYTMVLLVCPHQLPAPLLPLQAAERTVADLPYRL
jgi:hypothetical protein